MSKASDRHEHLVASAIDGLPNVSAVRPIKGTDFSDVLINFKDKEAWLEVKMTHSDNLANPRVYYQHGAWKTRYSTPLAIDIVQELNKSETAREFVYSISDYSGLAYESIYIPTNRSEMGSPNSVERSIMRSFCKRNGAYVMDYKDRDLTSYVTKHYTLGKTEPAYYMQAGDGFYMISNANPLGLSSNIPQLEGIGKLRVRVSNRSQFYEVQAELKMTSLVDSPYSVLPGSKKQNPFL
jgi:hypothetical protein